MKTELGPGTEPEGGTSLAGFAETRAAFTGAKPLLGRHLVESGKIGEAALKAALQRQREEGGRLGDILVAEGYLSTLELNRALGRQLGLPFVNLMEEPPDPDLLAEADPAFCLENRCLPWRSLRGQEVFVSADPGKTRKALEEAQRPALVFVTSSFDLLWTAGRHFRERLTARARLALCETMPDASARQLTTPALRRTGLAALALTCLAFLLFGAPALGALNVVAGSTFLALAALRGFSLIYGLVPLAPPKLQRAPTELPGYTIMVPLLQEAAILPGLTSALKNLDYPAAKLDIKLVLEEGDEETLAAAKALRLPSHFEFIIVPKSEPLTKPKALNYALPFARGEFLVVYDAEDIPAPDQLRMAVAAFDAGGPRLACVQGQLMFYNARETWLTRQSAIEYAALFELLLPALARFSLPFPLGGTSTHFRKDILKAAGAWDPFNVTEDADLGLRLHELGYRTTLIPSLTQEEATLTLDAWMRQRTRWLKGWMQTLLVRLKAPLRMARALRPAGFIFSFIVLGGFVLAALLHPLAYVMAGGLILSAFFGLVSGDPLATFHLTVLIVGAAASITAGLAAGLRRFGPAIALHALLMPFYWLLISAASYRALWQLIRKPNYWEKTRHGLSRLKPDKSR